METADQMLSTTEVDETITGMVTTDQELTTTEVTRPVSQDRTLSSAARRRQRCC